MTNIQGRMRRAIALVWMLPSLIVALSSVPSPTLDELRSIASASRRKLPGSSSSLKTWRYGSEKTLSHIQSDVQESLSIPVDTQALQELSFQLGVAADVGSMPSFQDSGARAGYAVSYFCRAQLMADLLFSNDLPLLGGKSTRRYRVGSLGGGPGFDFVAAALVASYRSHQEEGTLPTSLHATIFDYEEGWDSLVDEMTVSVKRVLGWHHSCDFAKCDITLPLSDSVNKQCRKHAQDTDIWFCSYCVTENAQKLRARDYVFFRELFSQARQETLFIFTETTHRMWPELASAAGNGFDIIFPCRFQHLRGKRQMIVRRRDGATLEDEEKALCLLFARDRDLHEQKIENGVVRQLKKVRGAK